MKNLEIEKNRRVFLPTLFFVIMGFCGAQNDLPQTVNSTEQHMLTRQSSLIKQSIKSIVKTPSESMVTIQAPLNGRWQLLSYGTVTAYGIVAKWSEIKNYINTAKIVNVSGNYASLKPIGIYESYDLVLLSDDHGLKPLAINNYVEPELGDFLALAGVGEQAVGFGVVSVLERSLKDTDKAFLGVAMDFDNVADIGVVLTNISPDSPAERAGLLQGDRIISIGGTLLKSATETRNLIQNLKPGEKETLKVYRGEKVLELEVVFEAREERPSAQSARVHKMESLGGAISEVRDFFPRVIQTDIQVNKNRMASPAFNLEGEFIGLTISRSRMKTYLIPADDLVALLKTAPKLLSVQPQDHYTQRGKRVENLRGQQRFRNLSEPKELKANDSLSEIEKELLRQFGQMSQPMNSRSGEGDRLFKLMGQLLKDDTLFSKRDLFNNKLEHNGNGFSFKMEYNNSSTDFKDFDKIIEEFRKIDKALNGK